MKNAVIYFAIHLLLFSACQNSAKVNLRAPQAIKGIVIGDSVLDKNIKTTESLIALIAHGDAVKANLKGKVNAVSKKGNWLRLENGTGREIMVSAIDDKFNFPQSVIGKEVILYGEAKLGKLSVEEQNQLAVEDANKPLEGVVITSFKDVVFFEARGLVVAIK
ncbi:DUF4920 domain-containing protein [Pedobacter arcticus]|uniref:DUF4920 domain-containing protein n=1 Tax=Pedobacter arcticus TaxID=752140 RepID=UPI00036AEB12|nr:DUF4920 domain-containing protein [Pedobacter arcticus]